MHNIKRDKQKIWKIQKIFWALRRACMEDRLDSHSLLYWEGSEHS